MKKRDEGWNQTLYKQNSLVRTCNNYTIIPVIGWVFLVQPPPSPSPSLLSFPLHATFSSVSLRIATNTNVRRDFSRVPWGQLQISALLANVDGRVYLPTHTSPSHRPHLFRHQNNPAFRCTLFFSNLNLIEVTMKREAGKNPFFLISNNGFVVLIRP